jgi:hypothetical protein
VKGFHFLELEELCVLETAWVGVGLTRGWRVTTWTQQSTS